jgi:hypothetical protein
MANVCVRDVGAVRSCLTAFVRRTHIGAAGHAGRTGAALFEDGEDICGATKQGIRVGAEVWAVSAHVETGSRVVAVIFEGKGGKGWWVKAGERRKGEMFGEELFGGGRTELADRRGRRVGSCQEGEQSRRQEEE